MIPAILRKPCDRTEQDFGKAQISFVSEEFPCQAHSFEPFFHRPAISLPEKGFKGFFFRFRRIFSHVRNQSAKREEISCASAFVMLVGREHFREREHFLAIPALGKISVALLNQMPLMLYPGLPHNGAGTVPLRIFPYFVQIAFFRLSKAF